MISYADFLKVDIRVGRVIQVEEFPEARRPALKLIIDFGSEIGMKKTSAQIRTCMAHTKLVGKQVLAVVNFPPKQIGSFMSEVLVLGLSDKSGAIVLVTPDREVPEGHSTRQPDAMGPLGVHFCQGSCQKSTHPLYLLLNTPI